VRAVDTHIKKIRKALGEKADLIETVIGIGYTFKEN
jgi:DNA-binding response OmpR family regulator